MLVFQEGGKPEYPEKNPRSKARTNNKLNPHMTPGRYRTRATLVGGERSHHYANPAPHKYKHYQKDKRGEKHFKGAGNFHKSSNTLQSLRVFPKEV
jgi:hypothetical protein